MTTSGEHRPVFPVSLSWRAEDYVFTVTEDDEGFLHAGSITVGPSAVAESLREAAMAHLAIADFIDEHGGARAWRGQP